MKKIIFILMILVTSFSFIGCKNATKEISVNKTLTATNSKQSSEIKTQPVELIEKYINNFEFTNIEYKNEGVCKVSGNAKNLSNKKLSAVVIIIFYDKDNKEVGRASGALADIESKQSQCFLANSTEEIKDIAKAEIEVNIAER